MITKLMIIKLANEIEIQINALAQLKELCEIHPEEQQAIAKQVLGNGETLHTENFHTLVLYPSDVTTILSIFPEHRELIAKLTFEPIIFTPLTIRPHHVELLVSIFPEHKADIAALVLAPHHFHALVLRASDLKILAGVFPEHKATMVSLMLTTANFNIDGFSDIEVLLQIIPEQKETIMSLIMGPQNFSGMNVYRLEELLLHFPEYTDDITVRALDPYYFNALHLFEIKHLVRLFPEHKEIIAELILKPEMFDHLILRKDIHLSRKMLYLKELVKIFHRHKARITELALVPNLLRYLESETSESQSIKPVFCEDNINNTLEDDIPYDEIEIRNVNDLLSLFPKHKKRIAELIFLANDFDVDNASEIEKLLNHFPEYTDKITNIALRASYFKTIYEVDDLVILVRIFPEHKNRILALLSQNNVFNSYPPSEIKTIVDLFPEHRELFIKSPTEYFLARAKYNDASDVAALLQLFPEYKERIVELLLDPNNFNFNADEIEHLVCLLPELRESC